MVKKIRLNENTRKWILDRVENREGLYWRKFIKFMRHIGVSKEKMKKYQSKAYHNAAKRVYEKLKKQYRKYHFL
ncbi:MAG: hypothetical protein ACTSPL_03995 [Candidatus Odinarchaeia archaeon]